MPSRRPEDARILVASRPRAESDCGVGGGLPPAVTRLEHAAARHIERQASSVAHELNNILTIVRTYTYFARHAASSEQQTRDLRIVAAAAERGTTLTDWLAATAEHEPHALDELSSKDFLRAVAVRLQLLAPPGTHIGT